LYLQEASAKWGPEGLFLASAGVFVRVGIIFPKHGCKKKSFQK
jgi:hypothetical protein